MVRPRIEIRKSLHLDYRVAGGGVGERRRRERRRIRALPLRQRDGGIVVCGGIARRQRLFGFIRRREVARTVRVQGMLESLHFQPGRLVPLDQIGQRHRCRHLFVGADVPSHVAQRKTFPRAHGGLQKRERVPLAHRRVEQRRVTSDQIERGAMFGAREHAVAQPADPHEPRRHGGADHQRRHAHHVSGGCHAPHARVHGRENRRAHHVARHGVVLAGRLSRRARDQRVARGRQDRAPQAREFILRLVIAKIELVDCRHKPVAPRLNRMRSLQESAELCQCRDERVERAHEPRPFRLYGAAGAESPEDADIDQRLRVFARAHERIRHKAIQSAPPGEGIVRARRRGGENLVHVRVVIAPMDVVLAHHLAQHGKSVRIDAEACADHRHAEQGKYRVRLKPVGAEGQQFLERMRDGRRLLHAAGQGERNAPRPACAEHGRNERRVRAPIRAKDKRVGRTRVRHFVEEPVQRVARRLQLATRRVADVDFWDDITQH